MVFLEAWTVFLDAQKQWTSVNVPATQTAEYGAMLKLVALAESSDTAVSVCHSKWHVLMHCILMPTFSSTDSRWWRLVICNSSKLPHKILSKVHLRVARWAHNLLRV